MTCFDEDQSAEITMSATDFAQMCDEMKRYWIQEDTARETADGEWVRYDDVMPIITGAIQVMDYQKAELKAANAEIDALKAEGAVLKAPPKILIDGRGMIPGAYFHRRNAGYPWRVVEVSDIIPGKLQMFFPGRMDSLDVCGEFIGPIKMQEV